MGAGELGQLSLGASACLPACVPSVELPRGLWLRKLVVVGLFRSRNSIFFPSTTDNGAENPPHSLSNPRTV